MAILPHNVADTDKAQSNTTLITMHDYLSVKIAIL